MIIVIAKKKKVDLEDEIAILGKVKRSLKKDPVALEICKEYNFDTDIIDGIPIIFVDKLEASAKTVDAKISLNSNLLDEEFPIIMRYAIHELVHALQHMRTENIKNKENKYKDVEYLDRDDELEAFQYQIKYDSKKRGPSKAKEYAQELVEYHDLTKDESKKKKKELLNKAF